MPEWGGEEEEQKPSWRVKSHNYRLRGQESHEEGQYLGDGSGSDHPRSFLVRHSIFQLSELKLKLSVLPQGFWPSILKHQQSYHFLGRSTGDRRRNIDGSRGRVDSRTPPRHA